MQTSSYRSDVMAVIHVVSISGISIGGIWVAEVKRLLSHVSIGLRRICKTDSGEV